MPRTTVNISTSTIFRIIIILLVLFFLYAIRDILVLLFFAIIIASAIDLPARRLDKLKIPRLISVLLIYLVCVGLLAGLLIVFIPSFAKELKDFSVEFPKYANELYQKFRGLQEGSLKYQKLIDQTQGILNNLGEALKGSATNVVSKTLNIFGGLFSVLIVIVISFYLAVQKNGIQHLLKGITPKEHEVYALGLWERAQKKMGHWLQGQLFLAIVVGVLVYIGLSLLHVRFALLLAIIAGILELVPYIGPVLSAIPAVILAFFQAPILALWVLILYIVVQQLENYLLVPVIMKKVVGLNPVIVIIALLIGGKLLGILGIILAVPAAAVLAEFFKDIKRK
ncbi:MAG: AI-2E family transporter [Candidatus Omnitrophica bacterium]|nr:AI-2E family transporter [Candidatus Omnitrophota bacterium]